MDQARTIKQQGNDLFKQQKFEEAIKCYKEAIDVCPSAKKEDLAIFHHNIGAVYDQMVRERARERERGGGGGEEKKREMKEDTVTGDSERETVNNYQGLIQEFSAGR